MRSDFLFCERYWWILADFVEHHQLLNSVVIRILDGRSSTTRGVWMSLCLSLATAPLAVAVCSTLKEKWIMCSIHPTLPSLTLTHLMTSVANIVFCQRCPVSFWTTVNFVAVHRLCISRHFPIRWTKDFLLRKIPGIFWHCLAFSRSNCTRKSCTSHHKPLNDYWSSVRCPMKTLRGRRQSILKAGQILNQTMKHDASGTSKPGMRGALGLLKKHQWQWTFGRNWRNHHFRG